MKLEKFKEKNKKRKSVILFTICCILLILGVFFYQSYALFETKDNFNFIEGNVSYPGDLYFAYYVDDVLTYDIPSKDSGYTLSSKTSCTNGVTISWNDETWSAIVNYSTYKKENNSRVKCTLYFEEKVNPPSSSDAVKDYIIEKAPEGTLIEDDGTIDHNLRYIGLNPNNYIDIGEKDVDGNVILWRIVGIMDHIKSSEEDSVGETYLKIIRGESLGEYTYGSGYPSWESSLLLKQLNTYFGNMNSDVSNNFLQVLFDVTNIRSIPSEVNVLYDYEHGYQLGNYIQHKPWLGKLGLLSLNDYGYATSGGLTTSREVCLNISLESWNKYEDCFQANWLYNSLNTRGYWVMAYQTSENYVYSVGPSGNIIDYYANITRAVFPVGYLSLDKKIDGEGTIESPFILIESL